MIINAAEGTYCPSYFYMNIDTYEDIKSIEKNQQTFVHEYIHFLQDLILPYCIRNNLGNLNDFAFVNLKARQEKRMVRPFGDWGENEQIVHKQNCFIWGGNHFENHVTKITSLRKEHFTIPTGQNVYGYILTFGELDYHVGARDFLEYIAHTIENKHWSTNAPDLPYTTVDKIFEYYGLICIPTEVRICIVEYCLYNDNPIHMLITHFFESHEIENNMDIFLNFNLCSEYLLNLSWVATGGFRETVFSKAQRRLGDLSKHLTTQYNHPQFSSVTKWLDLVIKYCREHLSSKFIFAELYCLPLRNFSRNMNDIIDAIGIPIIENASHLFMNLLHPQFQVEEFVQFYVLNKFMDFIRSKDNFCPIVDFCKANANCEIDRSSCLSNPLSGLDEVALCPFKRFIRLYGFHDVAFSIENS